MLNWWWVVCPHRDTACSCWFCSLAVMEGQPQDRVEKCPHWVNGEYSGGGSRGGGMDPVRPLRLLSCLRLARFLLCWYDCHWCLEMCHWNSVGSNCTPSSSFIPDRCLSENPEGGWAGETRQTFGDLAGLISLTRSDERAAFSLGRLHYRLGRCHRMCLFGAAGKRHGRAPFYWVRLGRREEGGIGFSSCFCGLWQRGCCVWGCILLGLDGCRRLNQLWSISTLTPMFRRKAAVLTNWLLPPEQIKVINVVDPFQNKGLAAMISICQTRFLFVDGWKRTTVIK